MIKIYLTEEQALVGIAAGMWSRENLETAKKLHDGHIKENYYLMEVYAPSSTTGHNSISNS